MKSRKRTPKMARFFLATVLAISLLIPVSTAFGNEMDQIELRQEFFANMENSPDLETVFIDDSQVIHRPQEYVPLDADAGISARAKTARLESLTVPYAEGDRRDFYAEIYANGSMSQIEGQLVKQGAYVNIWVLDDAAYHEARENTHDADGQCALDLIAQDEELLQATIDSFDDIYERMSVDFAEHNKRIHLSGSNYHGDVDEDNRVNLLLYNINGKKESENAYTTGYFYSGDFFSFADGSNNMDIVHMDIAKDYGYKSLSSTDETERLKFYNTFAHEFQHMLFYMYFGAYLPSEDYNYYEWLNEALSELAGVFYTREGAEVIAYSSRMRPAAENSYSNGTKYGDFLNFNNSLKNYGMGTLHSILMYKKTAGMYARDMYAYFTELTPPENGLTANRSRIQGNSMAKIIGDAFHGAGLTESLSGEEAFRSLYFLFMENFVADGGEIIVSGVRQPTLKFHSSDYSAFNLWGIRPALGAVQNPPIHPDRVYEGENTYTLTNRQPIPQIASGAELSLAGYGTPAAAAKGASHDMLYQLSGKSQPAPILKITVDSDGNNGTQYYVVVPKEGPDTEYNRNRGRYGADVYLLTEGVETFINTEGRSAYLFVATLYQNVNNVLTYSRQEQAFQLGDVNWDKKIDMQDVLLIYQYFRGNVALTEAQSLAADVNRDEVVDMQDVLLVYQYFRGNVSEFPVSP